MKLFLLSFASVLILQQALVLSMGSAVCRASEESLIKIRVRLANGVSLVPVRGFDLRIYNKHAVRKLAASSDRNSEWEMRCQDQRILAIPLKGSVRQPVILQSPVTVDTPAGFFQFRNRPYRDTLHVYSMPGSLCEVVNEVDIEKYLDGLVNAEFSANWNEESVAAQVVAARTYAYYQIRQAERKKDAHFDVDATIKDQVYDGSIREDYRSSRSVERTRGMILTLNSGDRTGIDKRARTDGIVPIKAFYHSTCGGMTELPEHVWGAAYPGYRRSVSCPFCAHSPRFFWHLDLRAPEITEILYREVNQDGVPGGWPKDWRSWIAHGFLSNVVVPRYDGQGRAQEVVFIWSLPSPGKVRSVSLPVSGSRFRDWIGTTRIRSTLFKITPVAGGSGGWRFEGRGNGHGVGMCQWGAKTMGESGYTMANILSFYYPDAVLRKAW